MYRRLIILSLIIVLALFGLSWLGYRAISVWSQGIEGTRISEFADVAEQIRLDVKDKLDAFKEQEQERPYTDYQYYTIPEESLIVQQSDELRSRSERRNTASRNVSATLGGETNLAQQLAMVRSPLAENIEHGLAYFNFQIDPKSNTITSPNGKIEQPQSTPSNDDAKKLNDLVNSGSIFVRDNLLPVLDKLETQQPAEKAEKGLSFQEPYWSDSAKEQASGITDEKKTENLEKEEAVVTSKAVNSKTAGNRTTRYNIESFQNIDAEPQIQTQSRNFIINNSGQNDWIDPRQQQMYVMEQYKQMEEQQTQVANQQANLPQQREAQPVQDDRQQMPQKPALGGAIYDTGLQSGESELNRGMQVTQEPDHSQAVDHPEAGSSGSRSIPVQTEGTGTSNRTSGSAFFEQSLRDLQTTSEQNQADIVEVTIDPLVTVVVPSENKDSIFGGKVFMLRRVKFEGNEFIQGFQLNEKKLLEEVEESTRRFMREGMTYEMGRNPNTQSSYTAILDFVGFGHLFLNLFETDPGRLALQINHLRTWYFSILLVVFLAVTFAVISLWLNARAQIKLAQKKDDFVSAVSHELRTPLTSIRMHAEMLEKNWIKSENKLGEYYRSMRAESERLSRLIENVLDFSRIQKGRKKYLFKLGDINQCVSDVVEMMTAYAAQKGFRINTQLSECREIAFDSDAVTQIVVNLLDNAVKYSSGSEDKTITVRTNCDDEYVLIEIEDHGPGIPHRQRKRIFQEFYRIGAEATRETAGSGLGLALVKKFAEAHNGFVEIISARPTGAIFRVSLAVRHFEGA